MPKKPLCTFSFYLVAMMLMCLPLWGQNNCDDLTMVHPTISNCNQPLQANIVLYNAIANHFGIKDTINCFCIEEKNQYAFRSEIVEHITTNKLPNGGEELLFETNHANVKISRQWNAPRQDDATSSQDYSYLAVIEFDQNPVEILSFANDIFIRYESTGGRKSGFYEEKYCNGNDRLSGHYCLIDSIQRDTIVVFNPNTLEEEVVVTTSYVHSKKTRTWRYYDINGIVEKEEEFRQCK